MHWLLYQQHLRWLQVAEVVRLGLLPVHWVTGRVGRVGQSWMGDQDVLKEARSGGAVEEVAWMKV